MRTCNFGVKRGNVGGMNTHMTINCNQTMYSELLNQKEKYRCNFRPVIIQRFGGHLCLTLTLVNM